MADEVSTSDLPKSAKRMAVLALTEPVRAPITAPAIRGSVETAVAQVFGVAQVDLNVPTRGRKNTAQARQVAMYVTHISCGINLTDVGSMYGRDRTTVAHACALIEDRRDDPVFDRVLDLLEWIVRELMTQIGCFSRRTGT
jgi:chromosomal replication initiation ATPase DnaA